MNKRRLKAMIVKEGWQVIRDPSALLIAFVLPPLLLFFFSYGISLEVHNVELGLVVEGEGPYTQELVAAFSGSPYLRVTTVADRRHIERRLEPADIQVLAVIPQDFDRRMQDPSVAAQIQVITDGSAPSTATFTAAYVRGAFANWLAGRTPATVPVSQWVLQQRFWFNPELDGRQVMVPGAIAIVMTIIGTLLTAMVIAREWERGTMEAMMSTPATNGEIILSKLLPYFVLGMLSIVACALIATNVFGVPLRGSISTLLLVGAVFLFPALGQGMLISTLARNQFVAAQIGVMSGFLPALLLSGFVFEISGMPTVVQWITTIVPARYFVASLQTVFLAGDLWDDLLPNLLALTALGVALFALTFLNSRRTLD